MKGMKPFYEPFPEPPTTDALAADDPNSDEDVQGDLGGAPAEPVIGPGGKKVMTVAEMMAAAEADTEEEEDEDEDEDLDEDDTEAPKPAFDSSGMNFVPQDPDETEGDEEDTEEEPKPAFDSSGMNFVPADPDTEE